MYHSQAKAASSSLSIEIEGIQVLVENVPIPNRKHYFVKVEDDDIGGSNAEATSWPNVPKNPDQQESIIIFLALIEVAHSKPMQK